MLAQGLTTQQGGEKYQEAFYVFEELAQASGPSSLAIMSQGLAELHLGRFDEAQSALQQALVQAPENADALANNAVLAILTGKDKSEYTE